MQESTSEADGTRSRLRTALQTVTCITCDSRGCTGNLGFAEDENGRTIGDKGDSGAPVYSKSGDRTAMIHGMEIAGTAPDNFYFHKISRMEDVLDMEVAHS